VAALFASASVLALAVGGCASSDDGEASSPPPPPMLGVQYATTNLSAPFELIEFEEGGRYIAERRPCGNASCDRVEERGTYDIRGPEIVFVDDATHIPRPMPYSVPRSSGAATVLQSRSLSPLATVVLPSEAPLVTGQATIGEGVVKVLDDQYAVLLCGDKTGICSYSSCPGTRTKVSTTDLGNCVASEGGTKTCCSLSMTTG
jgi:hypothetical protein